MSVQFFLAPTYLQFIDRLLGKTESVLCPDCGPALSIVSTHCLSYSYTTRYRCLTHSHNLWLSEHLDFLDIFVTGMSA